MIVLQPLNLCIALQNYRNLRFAFWFHECECLSAWIVCSIMFHSCELVSVYNDFDSIRNVSAWSARFYAMSQCCMLFVVLRGGRLRGTITFHAHRFFHLYPPTWT